MSRAWLVAAQRLPPYLELLYLLLRIRKLLLEQVTFPQDCFILCLCWASQADLQIAVHRRDKGLVSAACVSSYMLPCCRIV